jgi:hypothetical protein
LRVDVLGHGDALGLPALRQQQSLLVAPLLEQRLEEQGRGARQEAQLPDLLELLAGRAQDSLGGGGIACQQRHVPGRGLDPRGLEELEAVIRGHCARAREARLRIVEAPLHRLEARAILEDAHLEPAVSLRTRAHLLHARQRLDHRGRAEDKSATFVLDGLRLLGAIACVARVSRRALEIADSGGRLAAPEAQLSAERERAR